MDFFSFKLKNNDTIFDSYITEYNNCDISIPKIQNNFYQLIYHGISSIDGRNIYSLKTIDNFDLKSSKRFNRLIKILSLDDNIDLDNELIKYSSLLNIFCEQRDKYNLELVYSLEDYLPKK